MGSAMSLVEILRVLYDEFINIDPKNPKEENRDRLILSKGHGCLALYSILADKGFFPKKLLNRTSKTGSIFGGHPEQKIPGVEISTGALGHGLPIGLGMALSARIQNQSYDVIALLSDGECNEGSIWEAAMMAAAKKVDNLRVIIDFNKWQATGRSEAILALTPLVDKWRSFGWDACEIDGHNMGQLLDVLTKEKNKDGKPVAIIAHTVKGKGISFMEDDNNWHYRIPTEEELASAYKELGLVE